jgi:putative tryptophan/tyrosine transport system substrate-binding protein
MIRMVVALLVLSLLAAPLFVGAQSSVKVHRLGILVATAPPAPSNPPGVVQHMLTALRALGYVEGQNLTVERRYAENQIDRLPDLARDLTQMRLDAIAAISYAPIQAAMAATTTIPIIMFTSYDLGARFVSSLARPGGNITGVLIAPEGTLTSKRLELLREAVPHATRIAVLARGESSRPQVREAQQVAASLGVRLVVVELWDDAYDGAFAKMVADRSEALFVLASPFFFVDQKRIITLAAKHRLPAIYEWREQAEEGGLMAYGSSLSTVAGRLAAYVDRILKGAKPADLPVEQPTKFELVVNLKAARALGLTIPQSVLLRADEVIH